MKHNYISIDRIFTRLGRDFTNELNEGDVIEWCGEALDFIGAVKSYEEIVTFIEVKNHQCDIPKGTHAIVQIARNNKWTGTRSSCPKAIIDSVEECKITKSTYPNECDPCNIEPVWIDCNGKPIVDYELAYYRPYFNGKMQLGSWFGNNAYKAQFTPVRLNTSTMFNSLVCTERNHDKIYHNCKDQYSVIAKSKLRFSFRNGQVAIARLIQPVDETTGYPLVPDDISYTTAIVKYIIMKKFEKDFYNGRDGADRKMVMAQKDWDWYCGQASTNEKMISGLDEHQNFLDQSNYLLPNNNKYFSFFGNLATPEDEQYGGDIYRGDGVSAVGSNSSGSDQVTIINNNTNTSDDDVWVLKEW